MKSFANFVLFQIGWFASVLGAAEGSIWIGPVCVLALVAVHLRWLVPAAERSAQLKYLLFVTAFGLVADSLLWGIGATRYPSSESAWSLPIAPPWIAGLWLLFATLPHHSMSWLRGRPLLAVVFGAIGGPLSYLAGARMGAVEVASEPLLTWGALSVEYALATPLLMRLTRR